MAEADLNYYSLPAEPCWRRVEEIAGLIEVFDPEVQVCSVERELDPAIAAYLSGLPETVAKHSLATLHVDQAPTLDALPDGTGREALLEDIALLRDVVCVLLDCDSIGMRMGRLDHAMCPGWHVDRLGIRLVCTYNGPGTQWLDDQDVDRGLLRSAQIEQSAYVEASAGEIVLLKGSMWQSNERFGAVHRSPDPGKSAPLRTVITLDSMR